MWLIVKGHLRVTYINKTLLIEFMHALMLSFCAFPSFQHNADVFF